MNKWKQNNREAIMIVLRNLLILSLTLFVLIGCGEKEDRPQTSPPVDTSAPASDTTSDSGDGDVVVPEVASSETHNNKEESSLENNEGPSPAFIEASAKVADRSQATNPIVNEDADQSEPVIVAEAPVPTVLEEESDHFFVVNKTSYVVEVIKAWDANASISFLPFVEPNYKVREEAFLGPEDCVKVSSKDIKDVVIHYKMSNGDYINICHLGKCKAEDSKIVLKKSGVVRQEPEVLPQSITALCKFLVKNNFKDVQG